MNNSENFEDSNNIAYMHSLQNLTPVSGINNLSFICKICNKTFPKSKGLNRHMQLHGDKLYKCNKCDKSYSRSDHLKRHLISHGEDKKPFACEFCIQKFSNKSHLNRHIKIIHLDNTKNFRFKCDSCEETFDKKLKLIRHINKLHKTDLHKLDVSSNNESMHECYYPFCQRKFTTYRKQQLHINCKHNNNLNVSIPASTNLSQFNQDDPLRNLKHLKCPYEDCYKSYTTTFNLKTHIKTFHYRLKEYKCEVPDCNQSFKHKCSLHKHKIRYHYNHYDNYSNDLIESPNLTSSMNFKNFVAESSQVKIQTGLSEIQNDLINIGQY